MPKKATKKKASTRKHTKKVVQVVKPSKTLLSRILSLLTSEKNLVIHGRCYGKSAAKIASLKAQIAEMPEGQRGIGGFSVIKNGRIEIARFTNKEEATDLLKQVEAGEITLA